MRIALCFALLLLAATGAQCAAAPEFSSDPAPNSTVSTGQTFPAIKSSAGKITVTNKGNETLQLKDWDIDSPFGTDSSGKVGVTAGNPYTIEVFCTPSANETGTFTGELSFATNDPNMPAVSYELSCKSVDAPVVFSKPAPYSTVSFGNNDPGSSASASVTIMNTGDGELKILDHTYTNENVDGKTVTGQFSVEDLPGSLDAGESQKVTFKCDVPSKAGLLFSTVVISTNDPYNPDLQFDLACLSMSLTHELLGLVYLGAFWIVIGALVAAVFWFMPK